MDLLRKIPKKFTEYSTVRNRRRAGNKRRALEKLAKRINVGP